LVAKAFFGTGFALVAVGVVLNTGSVFFVTGLAFSTFTGLFEKTGLAVVVVGVVGAGVLGAVLGRAVTGADGVASRWLKSQG
jgi:hypothetical protein